MKRILILSALLIALLVLAATPAVSQERKPVKVNRTVVVTGVVIVDVLKTDGKKAQLQCNQDSSGCTQLKSGNYLMAELPENSGKYDCKNVEIYDESKQNDDEAQPLGYYCLIEK
ncbi:MAG TPA: hypothetical protein VLT90_12040 [Terriglobales bacterium]|nr:hypothetical protein [Terriglobales bacterium]